MIVQRLINLFINSSVRGRWNQIIFIGISVVRRAVTKAWDPLIKYKIGRFTIKLPLSHELPFHQKLYAQYGLHIVRITQSVFLKYPHSTFIDIGANVGDSIFMLRNSVFCPFLGIEGNPYFFSIMKENSKHLGGVVLQQAFVGERDEEVAGELSQAKGSSRLLMKGKGTFFQAMKLGTILNKHPRFFYSKILKIDTDGFELKIMRGARDWISAVKPIIFFEYDPACLKQHEKNASALFGLLSGMGYQSLLIYHNTGEYMFSVQLDNGYLIQDLHEYFSGRGSRMYCDICAFHQEDVDLFERIRSSEINFFRKVRGF